MTREEFNNLKPGDIIRESSSGLAFTVQDFHSGSQTVTATRVVSAINPDEWGLIQKAYSLADAILGPQEFAPKQQIESPLAELPPPLPEDLMEDDDAIEAVEQCDRILSNCDEIPGRGEDFAASIIEKVESMRETIVSRDHVTERQLIALQNMEDGVDRWIN